MDKEMLERAQLRIYLRMQIKRIRDILELQRLQALCKLKMLAQRIVPKFDLNPGLEGMTVNSQFNYLIEVISGMVGLMLHDLHFLDSCTY